MQVPLIPRIIFIQCLEAERDRVFVVPGTQHYLFWLGKPAIVKNEEILKMQDWLNSDISEANVNELKAGDKYVLQNSGFEGQEGTIHEVSKNRIQIVLKEIGMKITITKESEVLK